MDSKSLAHDFKQFEIVQICTYSINNWGVGEAI